MPHALCRRASQRNRRDHLAYIIHNSAQKFFLDKWGCLPVTNRIALIRPVNDTISYIILSHYSLSQGICRNIASYNKFVLIIVINITCCNV